MIQVIRLSADIAISVDHKWTPKSSSTGVRFEVSVYGIVTVTKKTKHSCEPGTYLRWAGLLRTDVIPAGEPQEFPDTDYRNSFEDTTFMRGAVAEAVPFMVNVS